MKILKTIKGLSATIILVLLVLPSLISCSPLAGKDFTAQESGKTVVLETGEVFNIKLESNQTTGYSWKLSDATDNKIVSFTSSVYEVPKTSKNMVGAGGFEIFYFRAEAPGTTQIVLEYVRAWEENVDPEQIFTLNIEVK